MKRSILAAAVAGLAIGGFVAVASRRPAQRKRGAFTLVELLVVMAIISFLFLILFRVGMSLVTLARESASKNVIRKVQTALNQRNEAFNRRWGGNDRSTIARIHNTKEWHDAQQFRQIDDSPVNDSQRLILARKLLYTRYNPQSKSDLLGPPWNLPPAKVAAMDNGEILFYMLIEAPQFSDATITVDQFSPSEVRDTDGDGNWEFTDSWGTPVHFWRWVSDSYFAAIVGGIPETEPHQTYTLSILPELKPVDIRHDASDPLNQMSAVKDFATTFHRPGIVTIPIVMSAGPDGEFGLDESGDVSTPWDYSPDVTDADNVERRRNPIDDNISSIRIRAGGN